MLMENFLNILFWRDYTDGHIKCGDRSNIFEEIKKATIKRSGYKLLDMNKILPFVNKLRKQIGLKELTIKLHNGTLMEMTPEVRKELILKELENNGKI